MTLHEFEDISNKIRPKLLTVARNFNSATGGADDADDIAQETLVTLWQLSEKGYPIRDAEALAVKITKNTCVAHYRKARIRQQPMNGLDFEGGMAASAIVDDEDSARMAESIIGSLTQAQQMCLKMRNEDGLSLDEIAAVTGKPKASVKTTISVARKQMLEQLKRML
ncbi:MAG: RNA polymerase sigma factor [Salinivirgaceae bacterium]|nr:RNA polymerase sigma factor [Salinivirgaceae bacterium]